MTTTVRFMAREMEEGSKGAIPRLREFTGIRSSLFNFNHDIIYRLTIHIRQLDRYTNKKVQKYRSL